MNRPAAPPQSLTDKLIELQKDPAERDLARCQGLVDACFASEDYREGQTAFMEKRKPQFKGR